MSVAIKPLRKFTTGTPTTSDMVEGEIAVNTADKKIFMRDDSNNIVTVGTAITAADDIAAGDAAVNITTTTGDITVDTADGKIVLDAGITGGFTEFHDDGTYYGSISQDSNNMRIRSQINSGDVIIQGKDSGGSLVNSVRFDMSDSGALQLFNNMKMASDGAILKMGSNNDVTFTHVHNSGVTLTNAITGDNSPIVFQLKSSELVVDTDEVIASIEMAATDAHGGDAAGVAAGIHAIAEAEFTATANPTKLVFTTGVSEAADASATAKMTLSSAGLLTIADDFIIKDAGTIGSASDPDAIAIGADGDVTLTQDLELQHDGAILSFGLNDEIALTHVHDTGLALTDSGGTPTLQFHDSNESVSSDGTNLILTSGGISFKIPTSDGSADHIIKTDGNGNLSFVEQSGGSVTIGENAPGSPDAGDMWWDSSDDQGRLKVYYNDGNSSQWVDAFPSIAPVEDRVILNGTDGASANAGDELLGEDNSFVQLEPATTDFFDNPVIPSIQFTNTTNAFVTTVSATPSADTNLDLSTLQTEDDVIGLIMAMG